MKMKVALTALALTTAIDSQQCRRANLSRLQVLAHSMAI